MVYPSKSKCINNEPYLVNSICGKNDNKHNSCNLFISLKLLERSHIVNLIHNITHGLVFLCTYNIDHSEPLISLHHHYTLPTISRNYCKHVQKYKY